MTTALPRRRERRRPDARGRGRRGTLRPRAGSRIGDEHGDEILSEDVALHANGPCASDIGEHDRIFRHFADAEHRTPAYFIYSLPGTLERFDDSDVDLFGAKVLGILGETDPTEPSVNVQDSVPWALVSGSLGKKLRNDASRDSGFLKLPVPKLTGEVRFDGGKFGAF